MGFLIDTNLWIAVERGQLRGYPRSHPRDGVGSLFHAALAEISAISGVLCGMKKTPDPFSDSH